MNLTGSIQIDTYTLAFDAHLSGSGRMTLTSVALVHADGTETEVEPAAYAPCEGRILAAACQAAIDRERLQGPTHRPGNAVASAAVMPVPSLPRPGLCCVKEKSMPTVIVRAVCKALGSEGAPYQHRTLSGIRRRISEPAGEGWTWRVEGSREAVLALGAYETQWARWALDVGGRYVDVVLKDIAADQAWIRDFHRSQAKKAST